jgi:hypothetical protein
MGARIIAVALTFLLMGIPVFAFADDPAIVTVGSSDAMTPGAEFAVPVSIEGNPGFAAAALMFSYNKDALELVSFSNDGLMSSGQVDNAAGDAIGYFAVNNMAADGVLFSAIFRVKDAAANGDYEIQVGLREGESLNLVNANMDAVPVSFTPGSVQITGGGAAADPSGDTGDTGGTGGGTSDNGGGTNSGTTSTNANTSSGQSTTEQPGGTSGSPSSPPAGTTPVTAVAADGAALPLLMRATDGGREYSLDDGATWSAVPEGGIVITPDGKRIAVDNEGDADYYVKDLPDELTPTPVAAPQGMPLTLWLGIAAGLVVIAAAIVVIVMKRRRDSVKQMFNQEGSSAEKRARRSDDEDSATREGRRESKQGGNTGARSARHLKEG